MKNKISLALGLFLLFFTMQVYALQNKVTNIKITEKNKKTRVEFTLKDSAKVKFITLKNPKRIVLDFSNVRLGVKIKGLKYSKDNINRVREGYPKVKVLRVVFDVKKNVSYKVINNNSRRIIFEIFPNKVIAKKIKPKQFIVVVDPGHGGKDPGAIGKNGTKEKVVVLGIARELVKLINSHPNMKAVLTRHGDYYVSLRRRLTIARNSKADLFIAIHADSFFDNKANGASVYALSQRGASSVAAKWLAKRENYSELGGVKLSELDDQSYHLRSVLLDLAQTATTKSSLHWGKNLLDALDDVTKLHYSKVETAPFVVLKSPDIPSLLVETGFISNRKEERRLKDKKHQQKLAKALYKGICDYKKEQLRGGVA